MGHDGSQHSSFGRLIQVRVTAARTGSDDELLTRLDSTTSRKYFENQKTIIGPRFLSFQKEEIDWERRRRVGLKIVVTPTRSPDLYS